MKRRMSAWAIWGVGFGLLCILPSVIALVILISYGLTGFSFWVPVESTKDSAVIFLLPLVFFLGNWPLILLPAFIYWKTRDWDEEPVWVGRAVLGSLLMLALANVPFWIGTPAEIFSDAPDAGQGTGILLMVLAFVSPVLCIVGLIAGWLWNELLNYFGHRKAT